MYFLTKKGITKIQCITISLTLLMAFIPMAFHQDAHSASPLEGCQAAESSVEGVADDPESRRGLDGLREARRAQREVEMSSGWPFSVWTDQQCTGPPAWRSSDVGREESAACEPGHFLTLWIPDHFPAPLDKYECKGKEVHLSKVQLRQAKRNSLS